MTARVLPDTGTVVNLGLPLFAESLQGQGAQALQVDWSIPAEGDAYDIAVLKELYGTRSIAIDEANAEVLRRLDSGTPMLTGVVPARTVVPALGEDRLLLHAGPPIPYARVCDPLRRSMRAATVAEGWALTVAEAETMLASGSIRIDSANDHGVVVPMATASAAAPAHGNHQASPAGGARRNASTQTPSTAISGPTTHEMRWRCSVSKRVNSVSETNRISG